MNDHLSRMDRNGQQNRVKRSVSSASRSPASGQGEKQPAPRSAGAEAERPTSKPTIGDETMVRLLIPRIAATEDRQEKTAPAATKSESVQPGSGGDGRFQSPAVAALAALKEPVQRRPFSSTTDSGSREGGRLYAGQDRSVAAPETETLASPGMEPDLELLPTRKELFPSQRLKMTRWFYNSLLYIFVIILIYLLWWGVSDSPWGKSHGL